MQFVDQNLTSDVPKAEDTNSINDDESSLVPQHASLEEEELEEKTKKHHHHHHHHHEEDTQYEQAQDKGLEDSRQESKIPDSQSQQDSETKTDHHPTEDQAQPTEEKEEGIEDKEEVSHHKRLSSPPPRHHDHEAEQKEKENTPNTEEESHTTISVDDSHVSVSPSPSPPGNELAESNQKVPSSQESSPSLQAQPQRLCSILKSRTEPSINASVPRTPNDEFLMDIISALRTAVSLLLLQKVMYSKVTMAPLYVGEIPIQTKSPLTHSDPADPQQFDDVQCFHMVQEHKISRPGGKHNLQVKDYAPVVFEKIRLKHNIEQDPYLVTRSLLLFLTKTRTLGLKQSYLLAVLGEVAQL